MKSDLMVHQVRVDVGSPPRSSFICSLPKTGQPRLSSPKHSYRCPARNRGGGSDRGGTPQGCRWLAGLPCRAYHGIGRRVLPGIFAMPRVGHHHRARTGKLCRTESRRAVRTDVCSHTCPRRTAPHGIACRIDLQLRGVAEDVFDARRQVLASRLCAARLILNDKRIIPHPAQHQGVGKALVNGTDIREAASGTDDRKRCARPAAKEKQSGIFAPQVVMM